MKVNSKTIIIFLLLLPHYKPGFFVEIDMLDKLFDVLSVVSGLIVILLFVLKLFEKKIEKKQLIVVSILLIYFVEILCSTILNDVSLYHLLRVMWSQLIVFLTCIYFATFDAKKLIKALFFISEICVYSNLLSLILYPNGMYMSRTTLTLSKNWLLGNKNTFFTYYIGFLVVAFLYSNYEQKKVRSFILVLALYISLILANSTTSILVVTIFIVLKLLLKFDNGKIINAYTLTLINIVGFFGIVIFRVLDALSFIIVDIFHKSTTLTGRVDLWDDLFVLIAQKPMLGHGFVFDSSAIELINIYWGTQAHNMILQQLLVGGIICLIVYIVFNYVIILRVYQEKETYTGQIIAIALFTFNIAGLTEYYSKGQIFILFGLASCISYLLPLEKEEMGKKIRFKIMKRS